MHHLLYRSRWSLYHHLKIQLFLELHGQFRKTRVRVHRLYEIHWLRDKCSLASDWGGGDERGEGCGGKDSSELHCDVEDDGTQQLILY